MILPAARGLLIRPRFCTQKEERALGHARRAVRSLNLVAVDHKGTVWRFVDEAVNGGRDELIEELFTPAMAAFAREWFGSFRRSFPDLEMRLVQLVAEEETVVGRFECSATHLGEWRGHAPTGRRFEAVDQVYFFTFAGARIAGLWGVEDTLDRFRQLRLDPQA